MVSAPNERFLAAVILSKAKAGMVACLLWFAEVAASFSCWGGLPLDASPDPRFNFWYLEFWRMRYWAICFSCASLLWLLLYRLGARCKPCHGGRDRVRTVLLWLSGIILAVGVELLTSVWFQRRLPFALSFGMSAWDLGIYMREHLIAWGVFLLVCLGAWIPLHYSRRKPLQEAGGSPSES